MVRRFVYKILWSSCWSSVSADRCPARGTTGVSRAARDSHFATGMDEPLLSNVPLSIDAPTLAPERRRGRLIANRAFGALKAQHNAERTWVEAAADRLNVLAASTPYLVF